MAGGLLDRHKRVHNFQPFAYVNTLFSQFIAKLRIYCLLKKRMHCIINLYDIVTGEGYIWSN